MTTDEPQLIALPAAAVVVVPLEAEDLLESLRAAHQQVASGAAVAILLVRPVEPRYCILHLEEIESLLARLSVPSGVRTVETELTWRRGATDPESATAETAIEVDGAIVAVALAPEYEPHVAMAAPGDDEGLEALPPTSEVPPTRQAADAEPTGKFVRTPHIDIHQPEPVAPGQTFDASVYLDTEGFRAGEHGDQAVIAGDEALLDVYVYTTPHFHVLGSNQEKLFVERSKPNSARLAFRLAARSAAELASDPAGLDPATGTISALFMHAGRPCGRVHRTLALALDSVAATSSPATLPASRFEVDTTAGRADLQITIVADPINNGRQFHSLVHSPLLNRTVESEWNLNDLTSAIVAGYMHRFTRGGLGNAQRLDALRGAGIKLFEAAPDNFKSIFWELVDNPETHASFKTIAICSEDPYIPWELMVPNRSEQGRRVTREPLGVEFAIGRSTRRDLVAPPQHIRLSSSLVVAPSYQGRRKLEKAEEEADMICRDFDGRRMAPALYAQFAVEFEQPDAQRIDLIHFACHGEAQSTDGQIIHLEQNEQLSSIDVAGHPGFERLFADTHPLVFMNACEVGRPVSALVGIGGFAAVFLDLGAQAVIAPLWSVKDTIAHEIATAFYTELKEVRNGRNRRSFAEILRDIRARAYRGADSQGEDTYAAYCFYGDPLASLDA